MFVLRRTLLLVISSLAMTAAPEPGRAQACLGSPAAPGSGALALGLDIHHDQQSYVAAGYFYSRRAVIGAAQLAYDHYPDVRTSGTSGVATLGVALPVPVFSLCPNVGGSFVHAFRAGSALAVDEAAVRVGMAVGKSLPLTPTSSLIVYITPAYLYSRVHLGGATGSRGSSDFGSGFGITYGWGSKLFGASLDATTIEHSDAVLALRAGLLVGGKH